MEQERQVRQTMTNRAGVLGLMLHSAYDHALASRIEEQLKIQREQRKLAEHTKQNSSTPMSAKPHRVIEQQKQPILPSTQKQQPQVVYQRPQQQQPSAAVVPSTVRPTVYKLSTASSQQQGTPILLQPQSIASARLVTPKTVGGHIDHQYLKSQHEPKTKTVLRPQQSDHQYFR